MADVDKAIGIADWGFEGLVLNDFLLALLGVH